MSEQYEGEERRHLARSPVSDISFRIFGKPTFVRQGTTTAGTALAELVPSNPNRVAILLVNNSDSTVYVGFEPDATLTSNIPLAANGGILNRKIVDEGESVTSAIWGIASAADRAMAYFETVIQE